MLHMQHGRRLMPAAEAEARLKHVIFVLVDVCNDGLIGIII